MPTGQEHPGGQRPRPHPTRPGRVDTPLDQRGDGEGKTDRKADIAQIKQRRVDGEPDILQDRVEIAPLDRRRIEPGKRVRGHQNKQKERHANHALDRQHGGLQGRGQIAPERGDESAEQRQDQHPQQHRALVIAPCAGDLVEHRLLRMRVLEHVDDGKIRHHVGRDQHRESQTRHRETGDGDRPADSHQAGIAGACAQERQRHLDQRQRECQHEGEMSGLDHHGATPGRAARRPVPSGCRRLPSACSFRRAWPERCRPRMCRRHRTCLR